MLNSIEYKPNTKEKELPSWFNSYPQTREEVMSNITILYDGDVKYFPRREIYTAVTFIAMNELIEQEYNSSVEEFFKDHFEARMQASIMYVIKFDSILNDSRLNLTSKLREFLQKNYDMSIGKMVRSVLDMQQE